MINIAKVDDQKGVDEEKVQPSAEEEKSPAAEVEGSETQVEDQAEDAQEEPEGALTESLPEEPEKQKKAFYAMRKKIEELEEKTKQYEEDLNLLNLARGIPETQAGYQPIQSTTSQGVEYDLNDPATRAFLEEVQRAKIEAEQARRAALEAQAQQEDFEAWQKYPQLNPKSSEADKAFIEDVQKTYIAERLKAESQGRRPPRLVEVADKVQKRYEEIRSQAKEQGASEAKATLAQKEAATLESRGTTVGSMNVEPDRIEELRKRVRHGDMDALTELNKLTEPTLAEE